MAESSTELSIRINEQIGNLIDLENRYQKALNRICSFDKNLIEDLDVRNYYQFCVEGTTSEDDFIKMININESKNSFIKRALKVIDNSKKEYISNIEKKLDLKLRVGYASYSKNTISQIKSFISELKKKDIKSINIEILALESGFKKSDLQCLLDLSDDLNEDLIVSESFDGVYSDVSLSRVIQAHNKIDDFVDRVNSLNLSPFEKFLVVHDYAASRVYKKFEEGDNLFNADKSRSLVNVMTSDSIVCVGYAQIVKELCRRLGIKCEYISGDPLDNVDEEGFSLTEEMGHAANIVHIIDEKYDIDGFYFCDSCWDSKRAKEQKERRYFYSALPIQDVNKIHQSKYFSHLISYLNIPNKSEPIPIETFKRALYAIYADKEQVDEDLKNTIDSAVSLCLSDSDNAFIKEYLKHNEQEL